MFYIILGLFAFVLLFFFDYFTLKNKNIMKKLFGIGGLLLLVLSGIMVTWTSERTEFPLPVRVIAGILWVISTFLLIYSLFLELPFNKTYTKGSHSTEVIDTGTYALCRHPGVLWFGMLFFFFYFTTGAELLIPAGILWTLADILHVYLQDKIFFRRMFPSYEDYVKSTPMLIPTSRSIKKCVSTVLIFGGR
jgi:protein-S-isoprenylcysteine O-methyltransferase Ste14